MGAHSRPCSPLPSGAQGRPPAPPHKGRLFGGTRAAGAFPGTASMTGCCRGTPQPLGAATLPPRRRTEALGAKCFKGQRGFSVTQLLAGTGRCEQVAFASSPAEPFLPRAAFLLGACRHQLSQAFDFSTPRQHVAGPGGLLWLSLSCVLPSAPIQRLPRSSSAFPLAMAMAAATPAVSHQIPQRRTSAGGGNPLQGCLYPRDAPTGTGSPQPLAQLATADGPAVGPQSIYCLEIPSCSEKRS